MIIVSALIIVFISSISILQVCAEDLYNCPLCGGNHDKDEITNIINVWVYNMKCRVYGGDIVPEGITTILKFDLNSPDNGFAQMNGLVNSAYSLFAKLGMLVMAVYVMYDLFGKVASEQLNAEMIFLSLVKLLVGVVVVNSGKDIMFYGIGLMNEIFDFVSGVDIGSGGGNTPITNSANCDFHKLKNPDYMWQALLDGAYIFIPWLISFITGLVISISCWSRVLDITVRIIFAPIGMADMITEGTRSSGWGYFKKLLAAVLKGSILLMTLKCYGLVTSMTQNMNMGFAWLMPILLSVIVIGLIFKTHTVADDIIGT
jgi:hypothetical protein